MTFTPTSNVDTFDIYLVKGGTAGTANVSINGGATLATLSTSGSNSVVKVTVTAALGANTLTIANVSGSVWLQHIDAYDSTAKKIRIIGFGKAGTSSINYKNGGSFTPPAGVIASGVSLVLFNIGINDWNTSVALATYQTNMQSFIDLIKPSVEMMLIGGNSTGTAIPRQTQLTFIQALRDLGTTNSLHVNSIRDRLGTYAVASAAGKMSDTLHPNPAGYADIGPFNAEPLLIGV